METVDLIQRLATSVRPVRPLPPPWLRTTHWLAVALSSMAIVVMLMSPREDLVEKLSEARFLVEQAAAVATAVTAAIAAFCLIVPGRSRRLALLPLFPLAMWLGSLGFGCMQSWLQFGTERSEEHTSELQSLIRISYAVFCLKKQK